MARVDWTVLESSNKFSSEGWNEELLHRIYQFPHLKRSTSQDSKSCTEICRKLLHFAKRRESELKLPTEVIWFPKYGCVLIKSSGINARSRQTLHLWGLDQWESRVHSHSSGYEPNAHTISSSIAGTLTVPTEKLQEWKKIFDEILTERGSGKGNQRTPSFVAAILRQSELKLFQGDKKTVLCDGSFADVGQHTGFKPRNTDVGLALTCLRKVLELTETEFDMLLGEFHAEMLQESVKELKKSVNPTKINKAMKILSHTASHASYMVERGHDMKEIEEVCSFQRSEISGLVRSHHQRKSQAASLPDFRGKSPTSMGLRMVQIGIPKHETDVKSVIQSIASLRALALKNITRTPRLQGITFFKIKEYIQTEKKSTNNAQKLLLILRSVEQKIFERTEILNKSSISETELDCPISETELECLLEVMEGYQSLVEKFRKHKEFQHFMEVVILSRELLVVWSLYCFAFQFAMQYHRDTIFSDGIQLFGTCLQWQDLRYLVLGDRNSHDTALRIAKFLKRNTVKDKPLFHLTIQEPTFNFAEKTSMKENVDFLKKEQNRAKERLDIYFNEVKEKRIEAKELKKKIRKAKSMVKEAEMKFEEAKEYALRHKYIRHYRRESDRRLKDGEEEYENAQKRLSNLEENLRDTEKAPNIVYQSLPKKPGLAHRIIFFLKIRKPTAILARLSAAAQQMLLPNSKLKSSCEVEELEKDWFEYFNKFGLSWHHQERGQIEIGSRTTPPEYFGPSHIDYISPYSNGVWYPDSMKPEMAWREDSFNPVYVNPFHQYASRKKDTANYFTERFKDMKLRTNLQWVLDNPAEDINPPGYLQRSNRALASQDLIPPFLNKPSYIAFASMRAQPYLQVRQLLESIHNFIAGHNFDLPFTQDPVHTLIRQTLYHIGNLEEDQKGYVFPTWKADLLYGDGLMTLRNELDRLSKELQETPKYRKAVVIFAEIADYASEWDNSDLRAIARIFSDVTTHWAEELKKKINSNQKAANTLRANFCIMCMSRILCHRNGELKAQDVEALCVARAQVNFHLIFEDSASEEETAEIRRLKPRCDDLMAKRIYKILYLITKSEGGKNKILTTVAKSVLEFTPESLEWRERRDACFDAECFDAEKKGHLYTINVLTGEVLYDGYPPTRLPNPMLDHPLYQRSFGGRNFEVARSSDSGKVKFKTTRRIYGRFYEFSMTEEKLTIYELEERELRGAKRELKLALLDATDCKADYWGADLPLRLQKMYSHWFSEDHNTIVLRGIDFCKFDVSYILSRNDSTQKAWDCLCVPKKSNTKHWTALFGLDDTTTTTQLDRLMIVKPETPLDDLTKKMSHFERPEFIHFHVRRLEVKGEEKSPFVMQIVFPRFNLKFEQRLKSEYLISLNHDGYRLARTQQLDDVLHNFHGYLRLETDRTDEFSEDRCTMLLIPRGNIIVSDPNLQTVRTYLSDVPEERQQFLSYKVHHRYKNVCGDTVIARLQLAALHAATSTLLPEARTGMTGEERAIVIVRQCWTNAPLSAEEYEKLQCVARLGKLCPALRLLCCDLERSSFSLRFLHEAGENSIPNENTHVRIEYQSSASIAYQHWKRTGLVANRRRLLTMQEERMIFGHSIPEIDQTPQRTNRFQSVDPPFLSSKQSLDFRKIVDSLENSVKNLVKPYDPKSKEPFPMSDMKSSSSSVLMREVITELKSSWETDETTMRLRHDGADLAKIKWRVLCIGGKVKAHRKLLESNLISIACGENLKESYVCCYKMCRAANMWPSVTIEDITQISMEFRSSSIRTEEYAEQKGSGKSRKRSDSLLLRFNPFLSPLSVDIFIDLARQYLRLCVLEDKVERILKKDSVDEVLQELTVFRNWDYSEFPEWLALEADSGLQIRPVQYKVAEHLLGNPGSLVQLNMGQGKTRVIMPMLSLNWGRKKKIVRLNVLSQLLHEGGEFLRANLCTAVLQKKLFLLPFCRDVELTESCCMKMIDCMNECEAVGGVLLVAPEHRLSLKLKEQELYVKMTATKQHRQTDEKATVESPESNRGNDIKNIGCVRDLLKDLESFDVVDVVDESDELLSHKYELVYAIGDQQSLPDGTTRWHSFQAILRIVNLDKKVRAILEEHDVASFGSACVVDSGGFQEIRLRLSEGKSDIRTKFLMGIANALVDDPPRMFKWMHNHPRSSDIIKLIVLKENYDKVLMEKLSKEGPTDSRAKQVLAFRGYLAMGTLEYCLSKRHRVDYGVSQSRTEKRLAVPFRANDTPSERAEFAHPDVAIGFTILSYYREGLSIEQIHEAVRLLSTMGTNSQKSHYDTWFHTGKKALTESEQSKLDKFAKIDLGNEELRKLLHEKFRFNAEMINFWLNNCVFPMETKQFPSRIMCNAWHLAANERGQIVGFSGTDDRKRLMPLQVTQNQVENKTVIATNGKMLSMILTKTISTITLEEDEKASFHKLIVMINDLHKENVKALIDSGALVRGISNEEFARQLVKSFTDKVTFKGVVFPQGKSGQWMILDRDLYKCPLKESPIKEKESFVLFDESRCRGADMRLEPNACAILTIGPNMTKDKLMQAAGRMRSLDKGQKLIITGMESVMRSVCRLGEVKPENILRWVIENAIRMTAHDLVQWTAQGMHFCCTTENPKDVVLPEKLELDQLYGFGLTQDLKVDTEIRKMCYQNFKFSKKALSCYRDKMLEFSTKYGRDFISDHIKLDEQCEKEIEQEEEREEEVEREHSRFQPRLEIKWDYKKALPAECVKDLPYKNILKISDKVPALGFMKWPRNLFCTENFIRSVGNKDAKLLNYLRPANYIVQFQSSNEVLLISPLEANGILKYAWQKSRESDCSVPKIAIQNFAYLRNGCLEEHKNKGESAAPMITPSRQLSSEQIAAIQVFNGEVIYQTNQHSTDECVKKSIKRILQTSEAKKAALQLVHDRGLSHTIEHSDLEEICMDSSQ